MYHVNRLLHKITHEMKTEVNGYYVLKKGVRYSVFGSTFLPLVVKNIITYTQRSCGQQTSAPHQWQ